jgi:hypothetical protein
VAHTGEAGELHARRPNPLGCMHLMVLHS